MAGCFAPTPIPCYAEDLVGIIDVLGQAPTSLLDALSLIATRDRDDQPAFFH